MTERKLTMVSFWYNRREITIFTRVPVDSEGRPIWTPSQFNRLANVAGVDTTRRHATRGIPVQ